MIKNTIYKLLLVSVVMISSSCNKWLDLRPEDGIIRQNYWQTKEQLQAAVIGCYSSLLNPDLSTSLFAWGELRADMIEMPSNVIIPAAQEIINGNILPTNSLTSWNLVYQTINYCNTVIEYAPTVNDNTLTEVQRNAYIAEARGLRALMYFYLLRTFGEVPLQLQATSSDTKIEQLAKSRQEEVFNQIIADLKYAEANAVLSYGAQAQDKGRITKYTVYAIQADAYLWMNKYAECHEACDKIIKSGQFALVPGTEQTLWFNTVFSRGNSQESIFEFQFDNQKLNDFYRFFGAPNKFFLAAPRVLEEMYLSDPLDDQNKDIRGAGGSVRTSDGAIAKFVGVYNGIDQVTKGSNFSDTHWFVYRYADILLLDAEALNHLGRTDEALALVKQIRDRATALEATESFETDPSDPGYTTNISKAELDKFILDERAREFAFEGKRWYDILRIAKRDDYAQLDILLSIVANAAPAERQQSIITKYRDVRSHYLPINQYELIADKNLVQNPFYE